MDRREFLRAAGALAAGAVLPARPAERPPNIIHVLMDDVGWGDLGCYGNRIARTPHIDRLAAQGLRFGQFYSSAPVCSPTRAATLTGRRPAEVGIPTQLATEPGRNDRRGCRQYLSPEVPALPRLLKRAGYSTAHVGKWHLGDDPSAPMDAYAYDYSYRDYSREGHTQRVSEAAIGWLRQASKPFFLTLWYADLHTPLSATLEEMAPWTQHVPQGYTSPLAVYHAALARMDAAVGRLVALLSGRGLLEETLVIVTSDNGPECADSPLTSWQCAGRPGPFRGHKRSLYEGGIRVPCIVHWPERVPAGRVDGETVMADVDLLPTLCALAGVAVPDGLAGQNMGNVLRGRAVRRQKPLMWWFDWERHTDAAGPGPGGLHYSPPLAIRDGRWKLLCDYDGPVQPSTRPAGKLYDMTVTPPELDNLASEHPAVAERLAARVRRWVRSLPEVPPPG